MTTAKVRSVPSRSPEAKPRIAMVVAEEVRVLAAVAAAAGLH
jgi:hypothetical protein